MATSATGGPGSLAALLSSGTTADPPASSLLAPLLNPGSDPITQSLAAQSSNPNQVSPFPDMITNAIPGLSAPDNQSPLSAVMKKYAPGSPTLAALNQLNVSPQIQRSLAQYDATRVASGSAPLDTAATLRGALAAQTHSSVTSRPKKSFLEELESFPSNVMNDAMAFAQSIPHLPSKIWQTIQQIPQAGEIYNKAIASGMNPIAALTQIPGLNLIPGSFTLGNIASGNFSNIAAHPLLTALDIQPAARELLAGADVTTAGELAHSIEWANKSTIRPFNPIKNALFNQAEYDPITGELQGTTRNMLGNVVDNIHSSNIGQKLAEVFGEKTRITNRTYNEANALMANYVFSNTTVPPGSSEMADLTTSVVKPAMNMIRSFHADMAPEEIQSATQALQGLADPAALTENGLKYYSAFKQARQTMDQWLLNNPQYAGGRGAWDAGPGATGEIYDAATLRALKGSQRTQYVKGLGNTTLNHLDYQTPTELAQSAADQNAAIARGADWAANNAVRQTLAANPDALEADLSNAHSTAREAFLAEHPPVTPPETSPYATPADILDHAAAIGDEVSYQGPLGPSTRTLTRAQAATLLKGQGYALAARGYDPAPFNDLVDKFISPKSTMTNDEFASSINGLKNGPDSQYSKPPIASESAAAAKAAAHIPQYKDTYDTLLTSDTSLAKAVKQFESLRARTVPARIQPLVAEAARQKMIDYATTTGLFEHLTADQAATRFQNIADGLFVDTPEMSPSLQLGFIRDASKTWQDLLDQARDSGRDPVFVHKISQSQAESIKNPTISEVPRSISAARERITDLTPGFLDAFVALEHEGQELLGRHVSEEVITAVDGMFGRSLGTVGKIPGLFDEYSARFRNRYESDPFAVNTPYRDYISRLIQRDFMPFNPKEMGYSWPSERLSAIDGAQRWIPREVAKTMEGWHNPAQPLSSLNSKITNIFRVAVTGMSPQSLMHHVVGGAIMTSASTSPWAIFRYWSQAREMLANDYAGTPAELRGIIGMSDPAQQLALNYMAGRAGEKWLQNSVVTKSFEIRGFFDNMYRTVAYLHGVEHADQLAGENLARSVMQTWSDLSTHERSVVRSVLPFYTFVQHVTRYTMRYTIDNPFRMAFMSNVAAAELADLPTGLPRNYLNYLFFGGTNAQGSRNAIAVGSFNPFEAIPHFFTVAGVLGAMNPMIQEVLQQAGVDRGNTDLYPNMHFDPVTGRMAYTAKNPITSMLYNTIPQAKLLTSFLGANQDFNDQYSRDPAAAWRSVSGEAGIPVLWRHINLPSTYIQTEANAYSDMKTTLSQAIKSGDYSAAMRYKELQPLLNNYSAASRLAATSGNTQQVKAPVIPVIPAGTMPVGASLAMPAGI